MNRHVTVRVTTEERELLDLLAFVRGTTVSDLLREHSVRNGLEIAREVRSRSEKHALEST